MTAWTWAWLAGVAYLVGLEVVAYVHGGYWATATGQLERLMLLHPFVALIVLGLLSIALWHLALDYIALRSK